MTVPQLGVLLAATACFLSYGWGLARFFADPGGGPGTGAVKWATTAAVAAHLSAILLFYNHGWFRFAAALALYCLSLGLFWWAVAATRARPLSLAFSPDRPLHLVTQGPYAFVRHPLYLSYMLCWAAGTLASGWAPLALSVLGMGWLYHRAALKEEEKFAASPLAADYARYARRAGRYLPRLF